MIIRDAQADDIEVLAAIAAEVYRSVFAPLLPEADLSVFGHAHFADRFAACLPRVRVIVGGDRPAGLCLLTEGNIDILF
ncbi:MAG TPA: hypothetical protein PK812_09705, partial [Beijerinckiaceae bacterium]|nr:hypothetical protein [Beijerinckiaceae bacterium]